MLKFSVILSYADKPQLHAQPIPTAIFYFIQELGR
jgi:hypothetical protein